MSPGGGSAARTIARMPALTGSDRRNYWPRRAANGLLPVNSKITAEFLEPGSPT